MSDRDQIIAALKAAEPVRWRWTTEGTVVYTPQEYEASIEESADAIIAAAAEAAMEDERRAFRAMVMAYLQTLNANEALLISGIATLKGASPPTTVAALRPYVTNIAEMTLDHTRGLRRIIQVLIDRGIVEGESA